jgi:hypothetical protein
MERGDLPGLDAGGLRYAPGMFLFLLACQATPPITEPITEPPPPSPWRTLVSGLELSSFKLPVRGGSAHHRLCSDPTKRIGEEHRHPTQNIIRCAL